MDTEVFAGKSSWYFKEVGYWHASCLPPVSHQLLQMSLNVWWLVISPATLGMEDSRVQGLLIWGHLEELN